MCQIEDFIWGNLTKTTLLNSYNRTKEILFYGSFFEENLYAIMKASLIISFTEDWYVCTRNYGVIFNLYHTFEYFDTLLKIRY